MDFKSKVLNNIDELQEFMILLAHSDNNSPIKGKLKLQKIMYLLADRIDDIKSQSSYEADMLGPYSEVVDEEAQYLQDIGVFTDERWGGISLTKDGKEIAHVLEKKTDQNILKYLLDYKKFLNDMTSNELLCFVYSAYPEMTHESVEYKRLIPIMEETILGLVKKQKISLERAAELLKKEPEHLIKKYKNIKLSA